MRIPFHPISKRNSKAIWRLNAYIKLYIKYPYELGKLAKSLASCNDRIAIYKGLLGKKIASEFTN